MWAHVKSKGLQNPDRKRYICPDNELSPFLGQDEFEMFQLGGKLKHHIISKKVEEESAKGQEPPEENEPREKLSTDLSQSDELTQQTEIPTESETPAQTYAETSDESIRAPRSDWPPSCWLNSLTYLLNSLFYNRQYRKIMDSQVLLFAIAA